MISSADSCHLIAAGCANPLVMYKYYMSKKVRRFDLMHGLGMSDLALFEGKVGGIAFDQRIEGTYKKYGPEPENPTKLAAAE